MTLSTVTKISFLFIIALTTSYNFSTTLAIEAVLDVTGSPVKPNVLYNIQSLAEPTQWVSRGKRVLGLLCPQAALLSPEPTPVKFLVDTETGSVPVSTDLNVKFDGVDECNDSGIWKADSTPLLPIPDITATGTLNAANSVFKIEKYNDGYMFNTSGDVDVGVWGAHLGLVPNTALKVGFVEATVA